MILSSASIDPTKLIPIMKLIVALVCMLQLAAGFSVQPQVRTVPAASHAFLPAPAFKAHANRFMRLLMYNRPLCSSAPCGLPCRGAHSLNRFFILHVALIS